MAYMDSNEYLIFPIVHPSITEEVILLRVIREFSYGLVEDFTYLFDHYSLMNRE